MTDSILCISQARMTSTRLPGKILKTVYGRSLLDYHTARLLTCDNIDRFVIATTVGKSDDPVAEFCREKNISCVRGSEDDVLARYYQAVQKYPADIIVRVTSDCPLIDPDLVDLVIGYFLDHRDRYDYITLGSGDFPRGLDVEVFSFEALEKAHCHGHESHQREHVTPYIYRPGGEFRCGTYPSPEKSGHHRWCVDTPEDFELVANILTAFEGRHDFSWKDCLFLFDKNPQWRHINSMVRQKNL
ncbi:MAG: acylneuraminate cytidylyltransferase [Alphaproteobacteria bacterium]|nr:MAG: acylneuraminate cytidylyltransferase [Alphaproteobacteria bacterium]